MMRAVVNVSVGDHFVSGQRRLLGRLKELREASVMWRGHVPQGCPPHSEIPFAFKAHAMMLASHSATTLLWCDSCIYPVQKLDRVWEQIERDGYLLMNNGWSNYEWTADAAYPDLFLDCNLDPAREANRKITHVVGGFFGLDLRSQIAKDFLDELYRLAQTKAFCGPTWNKAYPDYAHMSSASKSVAVCGPPDVRGHRHDQTAMSVIAWRLGMKLTESPDIFDYATLGDVLRGGEKTICIADGGYA